MIVQFSKYHGTGNDFVMIDGRNPGLPDWDEELVRRICHRRLGIGSDGLILLESSEETDFTMRYFNADGRQGTMCGNGGRCATAFARKLGLITLDAVFDGIDGRHSASLLPNGEVELELRDVEGIRWMEDGYFLDTGSPHFVAFVEGLEEFDVESEGRAIRHQSRFGSGGVNVNFIEAESDSSRISVRTFERGVEAETLSCGTGVTAAAIAAYYHFRTDFHSFHVRTPGGSLNVAFRVQHHNHFYGIHLTGPVSHVYDGTIEIGG